MYIKSGELQFFIIKSYKNSIFKDFQQNFFFFFFVRNREGRLETQGIFIKFKILSFIL